jgi:hypothetical protein
LFRNDEEGPTEEGERETYEEGKEGNNARKMRASTNKG